MGTQLAPNFRPMSIVAKRLNGWRCHLAEGGLGPHLTQSPGPRPTSIPNRISVYPAVCPQRTWAENWGAVPLCTVARPKWSKFSLLSSSIQFNGFRNTMNGHSKKQQKRICHCFNYCMTCTYKWWPINLTAINRQKKTVTKKYSILLIVFAIFDKNEFYAYLISTSDNNLSEVSVWIHSMSYQQCIYQWIHTRVQNG